MALAIESWRAPRPATRPPRALLRLAPAPPVTRAELLDAWRRALDAAAETVESAYGQKAFDEASLKSRRRGLRAERDWLRRFELDTAARFP